MAKMDFIIIIIIRTVGSVGKMYNLVYVFRLCTCFYFLAVQCVEGSPILVTTYILVQISKYVVKLAVIT